MKEAILTKVSNSLGLILLWSNWNCIAFVGLVTEYQDGWDCFDNLWIGNISTNLDKAISEPELVLWGLQKEREAHKSQEKSNPVQVLFFQ